jgi:glycosyltransferase involved in cell wall biosynthesis
MRISVITAVYNRSRTVAQALTSVLTQNYKNVETIVIDGASTDSTLIEIEPFKGSLSMFVSERDEGVYDALNKGIQLATGDVIGFLHADDLLENESTLARVAEAFDDKRVEAIYGDLLYVRYNDVDHVVRYWRAGEFSPRQLRRGWMPPHPTFYVRRSVYERLGSFDTRYKIAADYDSILRFLGRGGVAVRYIPEVLVRMRLGGISNQSLGAILQKTTEDLNILRRNNMGGVGALVLKNARKVSQFWQRQ